MSDYDVYLCSAPLSESEGMLNSARTDDETLTKAVDELIKQQGGNEEVFQKKGNVVITEKQCYMAAYEKDLMKVDK